MRSVTTGKTEYHKRSDSMLMDYNPDDWETVVVHDTCGFHKEHPEQRYPGCTCFSSYSQKRIKYGDRPRKEKGLKGMGD